MDCNTAISIIELTGNVECLNHELAEVSTPYLTFIAPGSEMLPGHMEHMESELAARGATEVLVFDTVERDPDGWTTLSSPRADSILADHLSGEWLRPDSLVVSTALVRRIGPLDESLHSAAMTDWITRCLLNATAVRKLSGEATLVTPSLPAPSDDDLLNALPLAALALRRAEAGSYLTAMNDIAQMALAGRFIRTGNKKEGTRLSDRVLEKVDRAGTRIRLGFVRDTEASFGKGRALGRLLFRRKPDNSPGQGTVTEK